MSEAELMQCLFASSQAISSIFSMFLTMVSAYIAGLYFFLNRAAFALRLLAFAILSIGLAFLGGAATIQQGIQFALFVALAKLSSPTISVEALRNPISVPLPWGLSFLEVGTAVGWITTVCVYFALGYMTFLYHWTAPANVRPPER